MTGTRRVTMADLVREPFRLFFPAALLAGLLGVLTWPLHFAGLLPFYPGEVHARLMTHGFFAGFVLGFLGTALPRMLSSAPLRPGELVMLLGLHLGMVLCLMRGEVRAGDVLLLVLLAVFAVVMIRRLAARGDLPPPGFVLVLLAFGCLAGGTCLSLFAPADESGAFWLRLQHLLSYQGFVLLPILGVGAFFFPRFFGLPNRHDFPESVRPLPGWTREAVLALATGGIIVGSFWVEAVGADRAGVALRLVAVVFYLGRELPLHRGQEISGTMGRMLRLALGAMMVGLVAMLLVPAQRVGLLHLTLVGGFAVITLVVSTRVIFGHSGQLPRVTGRQRWLGIAVGVMLLAMVTRVSGDFWPRIRVSHYSYGATLWSVGAMLWAWRVLPKLLWVEGET